MTSEHAVEKAFTWAAGYKVKYLGSTIADGMLTIDFVEKGGKRGQSGLNLNTRGTTPSDIAEAAKFAGKLAEDWANVQDGSWHARLQWMKDCTKKFSTPEFRSEPSAVGA